MHNALDIYYVSLMLLMLFGRRYRTAATQPDRRSGITAGPEKGIPSSTPQLGLLVSNAPYYVVCR
jgi:hypothetical protein